MAGLDHQLVGNLLETGDYSDFTIRCKGFEFKVHKVILGISSKYFSSLFRNQRKVSSIEFMVFQEQTH